MCDYSPHSIRNRLAEEGEDLVLHRFETGSFGFASAADLRECEAKNEKASSSIWGVMKDWLLLPRHSARVPTICVPQAHSYYCVIFPQRFRHRSTSGHRKLPYLPSYTLEGIVFVTHCSFRTLPECFCRICPKVFMPWY